MLLSFVLLGCNNEKSVYYRFDTEFKNCLDTVTKSRDLKAQLYMVIPRAGCGGCISSAEVFMIDCLKDPEHHSFIKFILTDFDSEKLLRARYGEFYKSNMLIIDRNSIFMANKSLKSIYPVVYFFDKNAQLYKVSQCSPMENGIGDITEFMNRLSKKNNL